MHDECNGSDVFGSDICTCRPYLTHAIEECIRGAQQGGVGLVVYSRKEGRALGEVTKFLVYNARKRQKGGDSADNYFLRTECVAGVQDMRFQELMPDVLHWLGIRRIHRLVSMSNMKYDAITASGIEVGERVKLPDELIPADARVEMDAKKAAGYFTDGEIPDAEQLATAKGRELVTSGLAEGARPQRSSRRRRFASAARNIADAVTAGESRHFRIDRTRLDDAAALVAAVTRRRYPDLQRAVPQPLATLRGGRRRSQGRARSRARRAQRRRVRARPHRPDRGERAAGRRRRAGLEFRRSASPGQRFTRSEGLAVASFRAFMRGAFSAQADDPLRVDASVLAAMDAATLANLFQVGTDNPLVGLDGRAALLRRLGDALIAQRDVFGDTARPGALFDTLTAREHAARCHAAALLWERCSTGSARSGSPAARSMACRSATCGGIRMPAAAARPRAGCRSTSFRSGWRIRCSNHSSGQASR